MIINFIGDVHGQYTSYTKFVNSLSKGVYSLQVGDFGFTYDCFKNIDCNHHKLGKGNHDAPEIRDCPAYLGKFGIWNGIFYTWGAWSIDQMYRVEGIDWWADEQLSVGELSEAIDLYNRLKPDIVTTHEGPLSLVKYLTNPEFCLDFGFTDPIIKTRTNQALQAMLEVHSPKLWVFGHYHRAFDMTIDGTRFVCLDIFPNNKSVVEVNYELGDNSIKGQPECTIISA